MLVVRFGPSTTCVNVYGNEINFDRVA